MSKPKSREWLPKPPHHAEGKEQRAWLSTVAFPDGGGQVVAFTRDGRHDSNPCHLTVSFEGLEETFRFAEQGPLKRSLRITLVSISDGAIDPGALTRAQEIDVWSVLCTLSQVTTEEDQRDETKEWVQSFLAAAAPITGQTLNAGGQLDALLTIINRPQFTSIEARAHLAARQRADGSAVLTAPALLVDSQTKASWARASEFSVYVRWMLDGPVMSYPTLTGRLAEIGVERRVYRKKDADRHPYQAVLYCLVDGERTNEDPA